MTEEVFLYLPGRVLKNYFTLENGERVPKITFGISQMDGFENIYNAVDLALETGYRAFDCSPLNYGEENLGKALEELLPKFDLKRSDILLTTKIFPQNYGTESASEAFWHSCENLKTNYIDFFLMEWPGGLNLDPEDEENRFLREETWNELVQLFSQGVIINPGVCNFTSKHLEGIRGCSDKTPVLNQVEFHPRQPQVELSQYCQENNILLQATSFKETFHPLVLNEKAVKDVAKDTKKTPTQVLLKWIINKDVGVICQSEAPKKIRQNFKLFDFVLSKPHMDVLNSISTREKYLRNPIIVI